MALLMYSAIHGTHASTQAYLGSVKSCVCCKGQKPKEGFRMHAGREICEDCLEDALYELEVENEATQVS